MNAREACILAGITYRQFDHWATKGYLPLIEDDDTVLGSGHRRQISDDAAEHLAFMAELVRAGVRPNRASDLARKVQEQSSRSWRLGMHFVLRHEPAE
jgi:DNA-binding transcriptional MerR regulator